jgi:YD repeat-containing protein
VATHLEYGNDYRRPRTRECQAPRNDRKRAGQQNDPDGLVTTVTPPGQAAHGFAYNGLSRLSTYTPALSPAVHSPSQACSSRLAEGLALSTAVH